VIVLAGEWVTANLGLAGAFLVATLGVVGLGWYVLRGDRLNRVDEEVGEGEEGLEAHSHPAEKAH
jgi:hypothetical protein